MPSAMLEPFASVSNVSGLLADLTLQIHFDRAHPRTPPQLPAPTNLDWGPSVLKLSDAELHVESSELVLRIFGAGSLDLRACAELWETPSVLKLSDDSQVWVDSTRLQAAGGFKRANGDLSPGVEIHMNSWRWEYSRADQAVYLVELNGLRKAPGDNLALHDGENWSSGHFRGEGLLTWHILGRREHTCLALVSAGIVHTVTPEAVRSDLRALEFTAGCLINTGVFWRLDSTGCVVGALDVDRVRGLAHRERSPVPRQDSPMHCWSADLFTHVSTALAPGPEALSIAISGYIDALSGHIHGQYRDAQTALEASCKSAMQKEEKSPPLVHSIEQWQAWVDAHQAEIVALARSNEDAGILLGKLRGSSFQRPTGKVVEQCFAGWGITLPTDVTKEIARRNPAIHRYVMLDEATDDFRTAGGRINMIQMLLSAVVAKLTGYNGPLVGWNADKMGNLLVPDFWTTKADAPLEDRAKRFACRR